LLRTTEAIFMVVITFGVLLAVTNFAIIPTPRVSSSIGLQESASKIVRNIDEDKFLTSAVFSDDADDWGNVVKTIKDSIAPGLLFKITAYEIDENEGTGVLSYNPVLEGSNFSGAFPSGSVSVSYTVTSPEVTVTPTPEKVAYEDAGGTQSSTTLYILKCSDARGWWITGFTSDSLADDCYRQMSPYFKTTVMVTSTTDFWKLLNGVRISADPNERVEGAIILNTLGECVPIPTAYISQIPGASKDNFSNYIGKRVATFDWEWISIVGYPFYYVSNTAYTLDSAWGIIGLKDIGPKGLEGFLDGIKGDNYDGSNPDAYGMNPTVEYTDLLKDYMNYYGIYPALSQSATRAFTKTYFESKQLSLITNFFKPWPDDNGYYAGAVWSRIINGPWTDGDKALADEAGSASTTINGYYQTFYNYGFTLDTSKTLTKVEVRLDASASVAGEQVTVQLSTDGGVNWIMGTGSPLTLTATMNTYWLDVTSWTSWTPAKINDVRVRVTKTSSGTNTVNLDWIPIKATIQGSTAQTKSPSKTKGGTTRGSFMALGLARTPNLKVAMLGILAQYKPSIYRADFTVKGTTRVIVLQLGQIGAE